MDVKNLNYLTQVNRIILTLRFCALFVHIDINRAIIHDERFSCFEQKGNYGCARFDFEESPRRILTHKT